MNERKRRIFITVINSVLWYIGYFCKEIFLSVFLTFIIFELVYSFVLAILNKKEVLKVIRKVEMKWKYILQAKIIMQIIISYLVFLKKKMFFTSGEKMQVKIPMSRNYEKLEVHLSVGGTFHGKNHISFAKMVK